LKTAAKVRDEIFDTRRQDSPRGTEDKKKSSEIIEDNFHYSEFWHHHPRGVVEAKNRQRDAHHTRPIRDKLASGMTLKRVISEVLKPSTPRRCATFPTRLNISMSKNLGVTLSAIDPYGGTTVSQVGGEM